MSGVVPTLARALAAGRVVVGAGLCVAPGMAAPWVGTDARRRGTRVIVRAMGARDAAIGLGALVSAREPAALRRWLIAGSASDAVDFAATVVGPPAPARTFVLFVAGAATVAGLAVAAAL
jgi:hypothetical protein